MAFRLRTAKGKLKIEHSILESLRPVLDKLAAREDIRSIIPGVIRPVRDARGIVKVGITVPTQNGWKAIALANGARQEFFISTAMTEEQLAAAIGGGYRKVSGLLIFRGPVDLVDDTVLRPAPFVASNFSPNCC